MVSSVVWEMAGAGKSEHGHLRVMYQQSTILVWERHMKPLDHFARGESLEQEQMVLAPVTHPATVIGACHAVAHHYLCAGADWAGINHERAGHNHTKHPALLKDAGAPAEIAEAWKHLEDLRAKGVLWQGCFRW
jgi:hypothetical protein